MTTESPTCGGIGSDAIFSPRPIRSVSRFDKSNCSGPASVSNLVITAEWSIATAASLIALFLLIVRATHAGALWRDESAAVQLAQMPTFSEIARNFQHEAFPLLFPAIVRAYINLFGASDLALRFFGIAVGLGLIAGLWYAARTIHRGVPLISATLLALNGTFLVWGTSVRGYGLGCIFIILAFACFVRLLRETSLPRIALAALASLAAVQCLLYNLVLIIAIAFAASIVALLRRQPQQIIIYLSILALCMLSFVPYIGPYSSGSAWSVVVEFPVTTRLLWMQFNAALGNPHPLFAILWYIAFAALVGAAMWPIFRNRGDGCRQSGLLLFGAIVAIVSLGGYYAFLELLSYLPRSWYYLALLALIAVTLDSLAGALANQSWLRIGRVIFAAVALTLLPFNVWSKIHERQTNIDTIATELTRSANAADLIVVAPWQYGISFGRYYRGPTAWTTLPAINDLRVHRYDLFREKMLAQNAIADVLEKVRQTLESGNRLWIVGGVSVPASGHPRVLPAPPDAAVGWDNVAYSQSWLEQLSVYVRNHSTRGQTIAVSSITPISQFEDVPLVMVEGWQ